MAASDDSSYTDVGELSAPYRNDADPSARRPTD
jgi:hypothetical protein